MCHRLETTITNQGLLHVLRNGIEDMGCKLRVCYFKPESRLNPEVLERYCSAACCLLMSLPERKS